MFTNIEEKISQLESTKITLKKKIEICNDVKTELKKFEKIMEQSDISDNKEIVTIDNIDDVMLQIDQEIGNINNQLIDSDFFVKLISLKNKILSCKDFLENSNDLEIFISDENNLSNITNKIKTQILVEQINNSSSESSEESPKSLDSPKSDEF